MLKAVFRELVAGNRLIRKAWPTRTTAHECPNLTRQKRLHLTADIPNEGSVCLSNVGLLTPAAYAATQEQGGVGVTVPSGSHKSMRLLS